MPFPNAVVSTFAGSGSVGFVDGTGLAASFNYPVGIATDLSGNVYVVDSLNNAIRKISPQGVVTTLAGAARPGYADAQGTAARFNDPYGIAVDSGGNVFVADTYNNRIRKITPAGVVTTFAGSVPGDADGNGAAAQFGYPRGIAIDPAGNLIIADSYNNKLRKITPVGDVSTLAGGSANVFGHTDGVGTAARFSFPVSVAVDRAGNIYVADLYNNCIRKVTPGGVVSTFAGSTTPGYADGQGSAALFSSPTGVGVDAGGNVFVADSTNDYIRRITPAGNVSTLAGNGATGSADGPGDTAQFAGPQGVTADMAGNVYVADTNFSHIRKIVLSKMAKVSGDGQTGLLGATLSSPLVVIVKDASGNPVSNASVSFAITKGNGTLSQTSVLTGTDGKASTQLTNGNVPGVCEVTATTAVVLTSPSVTFTAVAQRPVSVSTFAGSGAAGYCDGSGTAAQFSRPYGIAFDSSGNLYVGDCGNYRIRKITPAGVVSTYAGSGTQGSANGTSNAAQFNTPGGVAVDSSGNVYVADAASNQLRKITPSGQVSNQVAMNWPHTIAFDSTGALYALCLYNTIEKYYLNNTAAYFSAPANTTLSSLAIDSSNNLYVTDSGCSCIRKYSPGGAMSTVQGPSPTGGPAVDLVFSRPRGIVVTSSGNIYVSSGGNILEVTPDGVVTTLVSSVSAAQMILDSSGNIFASDDAGARILKITFL